ncbi:hypothetical protein BDZ89DRAFT_314901 [Hymenopellis radicata]|nr:hypothetical protein BDZ89DRAFT_314901 [Hymenopellis radicata]
MSSSPGGEIEVFNGHLKYIYIALHIAGAQIGLPILILTFALSKSILRHPTVVNLWITWVIYSVSYCILLYSGQSGTSYPPTALCLAQSALIHGGPPMSGIAGLMVVYQIWHAFKEPVQFHGASPHRRWSLNVKICLGIPYVVLVAFTIASAVLGAKYPEKVYISSSGLYCTIHNLGAFSRYGVPVFCAAAMGLVIILEGVILVRYYRMWSQISRGFPLATRRTSLSLILRVVLFSLYSVVVFCVAISFMSDYSRTVAWPYMVEASVPLCAVVIFGSQRDLFGVWCFWRPKRPPMAISNASDSTLSEGTNNKNSSLGVLSSPTASVFGTLYLQMIRGGANSELS